MARKPQKKPKKINRKSVTLNPAKQTALLPESSQVGLWKRLKAWILSAVGLLAAIVTIGAGWEVVRPKLQMSVKENPPNVFNAEFIVENKGMFTLDKCRYTIFGKWAFGKVNSRNNRMARGE